MPETTPTTPLTPDTAAAAAAVALAAVASTDRPVWLVEHPTHQYVENVKALARKHGLQVVDAAVASAADIARAVVAGAPQLTRLSDAVAAAAVAATAATVNKTVGKK